MNKYKIEFKWAIIFLLVSIVWMIGEKLTGLHDVHIDKHAVYTNFFAIPAIAVFVFALLDKRKTFYNGKMTYKQGFVSGLIITLIIALFTPVSQFIITSVVTPDYFNNVIEFSVREGHMTQIEAESYFNTGSYIIQAFVGAIVMGVITSAIVAIFTKKV